jgi:hypothetical protein
VITCQITTTIAECRDAFLSTAKAVRTAWGESKSQEEDLFNRADPRPEVETPCFDQIRQNEAPCNPGGLELISARPL